MVDDPKRQLMRTPGIRTIPTQGSRILPAQVQQILAGKRIQPLVPVKQPVLVPSGRHGVKVDEGYWWGHVPPPDRHRNVVNNDRPINVTPLNTSIPDSSGAQIPIWANTNCPPWNCPPYWSHALDIPVDGCVPWYLVPTLLGTITVPHDYFYVIKSVSYEVLGAVQGDAFRVHITANSMLATSFEDMVADAAQVNPALRYGLNGYTRPLPVNIIADRDTVIAVNAELQGPLNLAGVSPRFPGEPITTGNCLIRVVLNGWAAPLREQVDGGSRPTDLGNFGNLPLFDDQGGYQV
jgi:hypothetical protein